MPGQVTALYCTVLHCTAQYRSAHWLYWVTGGRSLDNKDSGDRGETSHHSAPVWWGKVKIWYPQIILICPHYIHFNLSRFITIHLKLAEIFFNFLCCFVTNVQNAVSLSSKADRGWCRGWFCVIIAASVATGSRDMINQFVRGEEQLETHIIILRDQVQVILPSSRFHMTVRITGMTQT